MTTTAAAAAAKPDDEKLALKFLGMSAAIDNPPEVGDVQTFTVTARCVGYGADERQSGGLVGYRKMRVLDVEPGAIEKAPPQAEQLTLGDPPQLGDDDPDDDVEDDVDEGQGAGAPRLATVSPFAPPPQP